MRISHWVVIIAVLQCTADASPLKASEPEFIKFADAAGPKDAFSVHNDTYGLKETSGLDVTQVGFHSNWHSGNCCGGSACGYGCQCSGCGQHGCGCGQQGCGCGGSSCCGCRKLFQSDHCFDGFIEPVTNPVRFIDPRSMTRLRGLFINQLIPEDSILGGGDLQLYAAQLSVALNERLSVIAQKDGYITLQSDALGDSSGWGDLACGFKYVLVRDPEEQFLLSSGLIYEWNQGSSDVFQGNGDGLWTFFLTMGQEFDTAHFVATIGWNIPNNPNLESTSFYYSLHLDNEIAEDFYALLEMNGIQYTRSGGLLPGVTTEGGDLINLGAGDVAGNHFLSLAVGAVYKLSESVHLGGAWEFPLTQRKDLFESRTTATLSFIY